MTKTAKKTGDTSFFSCNSNVAPSGGLINNQDKYLT